MTGYVQDGVLSSTVLAADDIYMIEPLHRYVPDPAKRHIVYRRSDLNMSQSAFFEGNTLQRLLEDQAGVLGQQRYTEAAQRSRRVFNPSQHHTCEMAMISDYLFFSNDGGSNLITTQNILISYLDTVSSIYSRTSFDFGVGSGISVALKFLEVEDVLAQDFYNGASTTSANDFLNHHTARNWRSYCLAHVFTRRDFDGGVLGLAWVGTPSGGSGVGICAGATSTSYNTGIETSVNFGASVSTLVQIITLAHEIGHNFGANHDVDGRVDSEGNPCSGLSQGNYIMYDRATDGTAPNNDVFSPCSTEDMGRVIAARAEQCFTGFFFFFFFFFWGGGGGGG